MKVNGIETSRRQVDVEISTRDVFESLRKEVFSKLKLPTCDMPFIKDGKIMVEEEEHGHTTYWTTKVLSDKPSKDQITAIETFDALINLIQKLEVK